MKKILPSLALITFFLLSCSDEKNISKNNIQMLQQANHQLISTIEFYEKEMTFSDTIAYERTYRLDSEDIIVSYKKVKESLESNKSPEELNVLFQKNISSLLNEIEISIESDRKKWKNLIGSIKETLEQNEINTESKDSKNQIIAKNEITYNMIFQLILRHKFEEEFEEDYRSPLIRHDTLLKDGRREIEIYAYTARPNNFESLDLIFDNERKTVDFEKGQIPIFAFTYDPQTIKDTVKIKIESKNYLNKEMRHIVIDYPTIKDK